jgi:hypothetical protein
MTATPARTQSRWPMVHVCQFLTLVISSFPSLIIQFFFFHILHVPGISKHLLSIQCLAHDYNAFLELHPSFFYVKDQATQRILLRGRSHHGLYLVPCLVSSASLPSHAALSSITASGDLWHYWLGHPSSSVIVSVIRSNKLACMPVVLE